MDADNLLYFIDDPTRITTNDLEGLETIASDYPYFQLAHMLIAKGSSKENSPLASQKLRRAAAYSYHRGLLRQLIETQKYEPLLWQKTTIENPKESSFEDIFIADPKEEEIDENFNFLPTTPENEDTIPDGEPFTEALAMKLYTQGKTNAAIQVYEHLRSLYPDKNAYFETQIRTIRGEETLLETENNEIHTFTPSIETTESTPDLQTNYLETETSIISTTEENKISEETTEVEATTIDTEPENPLTESQALKFINENEWQAALDVYQKLKKLSPEKADYYENQINILEETLNQHNIQKITEETTEENISFFDTILEEQETTQDATTYTPENFIQTTTTTDIQEEYETESSNTIVLKEGFLMEQDAAEAAEDKSLKSEANNPIELSQVDNPNEALAMQYFNAGDTAKAMELYKKLILFNPEKETYYLRQIEILSSDIETLNQEYTTTPEKTDKKEENIMVEEEKITTFAPTIENNDEISETTAIQYFNEGNMTKAIQVYEKLMEKYPDKKDYFQSQIEVLKS
ncbi:MAG: hypothetical protein EAZ55_02940 [Cytophagales bacterium]|nr:MAG: hypothetical protein EAZ55_02940 [Cytophagales bacterium]